MSNEWSDEPFETTHVQFSLTLVFFAVFKCCSVCVLLTSFVNNLASQPNCSKLYFCNRPIAVKIILIVIKIIMENIRWLPETKKN